MTRSRDEVTDGLEVEVGARKGMACFTPVTEAGMRKVGFDTHDFAVVMMTIYWGRVLFCPRKSKLYQPLGSRGGKVAQFPHHCTICTQLLV